MANIKFKDICKLVNVSVGKEGSVADSFLADLNYSIKKQNNENSPNIVSQTYKPSSLNCIRNMYYQITGTEIDTVSDTTADSIGVAESGTDRHERIQNAICHMKDSGIDCEYIDVETYIKQFNIPNLEVVEKKGYETKLVNTKYNFRFMCDGIIKYKGQYYLLEIKTEVSFKWNNRINVDPSHYKQATAYALNFGLHRIIFIYENRDTCSKKSYLYQVNQTQIEDLVALINECDNYVNSNTVPPKPESIKYSNKQCNYCSYKKRCSAE